MRTSVLAAALVLATLPAACWGSPGNIVRGRGLLQSTIPFCPAAVTEETAAEVAPPACQPGTTEYKDRCYASCKSPLTKAPNRPDLCLKACTGTLTSGDGGAVAGSTKCIRCPSASPEYILSTNRCYPSCTSGTAVKSLCCPACPSGFNQHNSTHCRKANTTPPVYRLRPTPCQVRNASIPIKQISRLAANPPLDKRCADDATLVDDLCYSCPEGLTLEDRMQANGTYQLKCTTQPICFDDTVSCGRFCVASNFFQQTEAFLYDEMCDMAMGRLPSKCYASCDLAFPLPDAPASSPVCPALISERKEPNVQGGSCPANATEYLGRCYTNGCVAPQTARANRPDQCLNPCTGTLTSGDGGAVAGSTQCIRCPSASPEYILSTNRCYPSCTSGTAVGSLCCPACPSGFNQHNSTHCRKANTSPSVYVLRASPCQVRNASIPIKQISRVVDKTPVYKQCGEGATFINNQCYTCPEGLKLDVRTLLPTQDGLQLQCTIGPDCDAGSVACGGFCVKKVFYEGSGLRTDDECYSVFSQLPQECLVDCDLGDGNPLPTASPPPPPPSPRPLPDSSGCVPSNATCVCTTPVPRTGRYADQSSGCKKYYECGEAGQSSYRRDCGTGLQFNNAIQQCDWPENVQCTTEPEATPSPPPPGGGSNSSSSGDGGTGTGVARYLSSSLWSTIFRNINNFACTGAGFYTYEAFIAATKVYPQFANTADDDLNRRELAAFLAQISHEVTGGPAENNLYDWGLCWKVELCVQAGNDAACASYCDPTTYPCKAGKKYYGRGPIQLSWNYNYAQAGPALGLDLLNNPDLVHTNASVAFQTALWFWMTPQDPKPSCHAVMTGGYTPSAADISAGRVPGYGLTTNIINGGLECNQPTTPAVWDRINYFSRYSALLGTTMGTNLECSNQRWFGW